MKQTTCCIIGHPINKFTFRYNETQEKCIKLKMKLAVHIEEMRNKGVITFLASMAQIEGIWGAEIVLDLKRAYPDDQIRLVVIIADKKRLSRCPPYYCERYFNILAKANQTIILQKHYAKNPFHSCGCFMADVSAHIIAISNGKSGATRHTLKYVRKNRLEIVLINPKDITKTPVWPLKLFDR